MTTLEQIPRDLREWFYRRYLTQEEYGAIYGSLAAFDEMDVPYFGTDLLYMVRHGYLSLALCSKEDLGENGNAIDLAARKDQLEILQWIFDDEPCIGCCWKAFLNKCPKVLQWLKRCQPEDYQAWLDGTFDHENYNAYQARLGNLEWLQKHRTEESDSIVLHQAARGGWYKIIRWYSENWDLTEISEISDYLPAFYRQDRRILSLLINKYGLLDVTKMIFTANIPAIWKLTFDRRMLWMTDANLNELMKTYKSALEIGNFASVYTFAKGCGEDACFSEIFWGRIKNCDDQAILKRVADDCSWENITLGWRHYGLDAWMEKQQINRAQLIEMVRDKGAICPWTLREILLGWTERTKIADWFDGVKSSTQS